MCPIMCHMTTQQVDPAPIDPTADPAMAALTLLAHADGLGHDAMEWRRAERHDMAGRCREQERALMKRAEILAHVATAFATEKVAEELARINLSR